MVEITFEMPFQRIPPGHSNIRAWIALTEKILSFAIFLIKLHSIVK